MKRLLFAYVALLTALSGWAVNQTDYFDPSVFPVAFEWDVVRYDYYKATNTADPELVRTQDVKVIWDPYYVNAQGGYGKITLANFYDHSRLYDVCDLVFDNEKNKTVRGNCNFQWNDDFTKCQFSLTPYYFSEASNTTGAYYTGAKSALLASGEYSSSGSRYWIQPDYATSNTSKYVYSAIPLTFEIDIVNKTLTILNNTAWGVFMRTTPSSGSSYVLEAFALSSFEVKPPTTLAWIEEFGKRNTAYTVADQLVGVYAHEGSLWCKDQGNISIEKTTNPGNIDYMKGLMATMHGIDPSLEWDQSNWVELDFGTVTPERATQIKNTYVGHTIKAGTIQGTYADSINYRIEVSADPEVDGDLSYTPNYYCPVNFMGETEVSTTDKTFYFLNPKAQEYAIATMAVWNGGDVFVVPAKDDASGVNSADLSGAFTVNWDLNCQAGDAVKPNLSTSTAYEFHAILRRGTVQLSGENPRYIDSVTGKAVTPNDKYVVYPLDLTDSSNISTAISDVRVERENTGDGYYYTITGQRVTNPTPGFYIHNGKKVIVR